VFIPEARFDTKFLLRPKNIALFLFFLKIVVVPFTLIFFGNYVKTLPWIPSTHSMDIAICIEILAFICLIIGLKLNKKVRKTRDWNQHIKLDDHVPWRKLIIIMAALGLIGFKLSFGSINEFLSYFLEPLRWVELTSNKTSIQSFLGLILRPFLGYSVAYAWCRWIDKRSSKINLTVGLIVTLIAMALVAAASMDFNRASVFVPVLAIIGVFLAKIPKRRFLLGALWFSFLIVIIILFANYRATVYSGAMPSRPNMSEEFLGLLQNYFGAPQFLGFILEITDFGSTIFLGKTIIPSLMYPIPVFGKPFRSLSGPFIYNTWIYGLGLPSFDQILPNIGELFINFHLFGVLIGYIFLGVLLAYVEHLFNNSTQKGSVYIFTSTVIGYWIAQLIANTNLAITSQILFYKIWPIYTLYFFGRFYNSHDSVKGGSVLGRARIFFKSSC